MVLTAVCLLELGVEAGIDCGVGEEWSEGVTLLLYENAQNYILMITYQGSKSNCEASQGKPEFWHSHKQSNCSRSSRHQETLVPFLSQVCCSWCSEVGAVVFGLALSEQQVSWDMWSKSLMAGSLCASQRSCTLGSWWGTDGYHWAVYYLFEGTRGRFHPTRPCASSLVLALWLELSCVSA